MMLNPITLAINRESAAAAFWQNSLFLDFDNYNKSLDPRITFSRASSATYFDSTGTLQTASSGVARAHAFQDHNPSTLTPLGFLIEEQRTNLIITSGDLASANWTKTNVTQAAISSSKGFPFAFSVSGNAGSSLKALRPTTPLTVTAGAVYTAWAVVAYDDCRYISFTLDDTATTNGVWTAFDLSLGTITQAATAYGTGASASSSITAIGGGLYVITLTGTAGSSATSARWAISHQASGTSQFANFDTTTKYKFYHAQLELGAFRTSVIHTTGAAAARLADTASVTGTNFSQIFNASAGTLLVTHRSIGTPSLVGLYQVRKDGSGSDEITIRYGSALGGSPGSVDMYVRAGGVTQVDSGGSAIAVGTLYKTALAYAANDCALVTNGGAAQTDTVVTLPTGIVEMVIGGNGFCGHIPQASYYRSRLATTSMQGITS